MSAISRNTCWRRCITRRSRSTAIILPWCSHDMYGGRSKGGERLNAGGSNAESRCAYVLTAAKLSEQVFETGRQKVPGGNPEKHKNDPKIYRGKQSHPAAYDSTGRRSCPISRSRDKNIKAFSACGEEVRYRLCLEERHRRRAAPATWCSSRAGTRTR